MATDPTIGLNLQRLRRTAGFTQEQLAEHAGLAPDIVRKLEQGQRGSARIGTLRRLADALGVDVAELVGDPSRRAHHGTADHIAGLVHHLRVLDDTQPTGSLITAAAQVTTLAETILSTARASDATPIGRRAAEASLMHWWLCADAGHPAHAAADHTIALATEWGAPSIIGYLYSWRAGLAVNNGDPHTATRLAHVGRNPRWAMSPGGRAWAAAHEARALTLADRPDQARRAIDDAQEAYGEVDPDDEPPWLYWMVDPILTLDRLDIELLRVGPDAVPPIEQALQALPPDRARDHAWYRARIAAARVRAGDVEGAARDAERAAQLTASTGTTWTMAELARLARHPHLAPLREVLADHP